MNLLLSQLLVPAIFTGVGVLIRHLWPSVPAVPAPGTPAKDDPYKGLPGLPGHPLLNSTLVSQIFQELEAQLISGMKAQVLGNLLPPTTPTKA